MFDGISSTVRLEFMGDRRPTLGTGFLFNFSRSGHHEGACIVTTAQALASIGSKDINPQKRCVKVHVPIIANGVRRSMVVQIECISERSLLHEAYEPEIAPTKGVDIGVIRIGDCFDASGRLLGFELDACVLSFENLPTAEDIESMGAVEEVIAPGCPFGYYDDENGVPLTRRGVTTTPYRFDFTGSPAFLADMPAFRGTSGSPVFLTHGTRAATSPVLIGVSRGAIEGDENLIVAMETNKEGELSAIRMPIGVSVCAKSNQLLYFEQIMH